ncbi:hypothetical protein [Calothrix sp. NIES-3974]|uniref:hypothetical protein n=1 Tax=Calothrix sp. NIES-3974 TaxID=2005462 RepID=UPI000BBBC27F|nr:hypothetical protein [Calothrix sp. NIES-3974]
MNVIFYGVVGWCLGLLQINLIFWGLGIFLYHYYLVNLEYQEKFNVQGNYQQQKPLVVMISGLLASAIAMAVQQTKPSFSIYESVAIGLVTIINSWIGVKLKFHLWSYQRSLVYSTGLAELGLLLGNLIQIQS